MNDFFFFQSPHASSNSSAICTWKAHVVVLLWWNFAKVLHVPSRSFVLSPTTPNLYTTYAPYLLPVASLAFYDHIYFQMESSARRPTPQTQFCRHTHERRALTLWVTESPTLLTGRYVIFDGKATNYSWQHTFASRQSNHCICWRYPEMK